MFEVQKWVPDFTMAFDTAWPTLRSLCSDVNKINPRCYVYLGRCLHPMPSVHVGSSKSIFLPARQVRPRSREKNWRMGVPEQLQPLTYFQSRLPSTHYAKLSRAMRAPWVDRFLNNEIYCYPLSKERCGPPIAIPSDRLAGGDRNLRPTAT